MTQEDKELLLKDLCARLPYGVIVLEDIDKTFDGGCVSELVTITEIKGEKMFLTKNSLTPVTIEEIRPYLRPMSSMTENEYKELKKISDYYGLAPFEFINDWEPNYHITDWLNRKMLDYRGLIEKDLALKALEGMYNKH